MPGNGHGGARAGAGRPPRAQKLTEEVAADLIASVREAQFIEVAAARVGIHKETLYDWLRRGAGARVKEGRLTQTEKACLDLSDGIRTAAAEAEHELVNGIRRGGLGPVEVEVVTTTEGTVWSEEQQRLVNVNSTVTRHETRPGDWRALLAVSERRWRRWNLRQLVEAQGDDDPGEAGGAALTARDQVLGRLDAMTENLEGLAAGGLGLEGLEDDDEGGNENADAPEAGPSVPDPPEPRRGPRILDPGEAE